MNRGTRPEIHSCITSTSMTQLQNGSCMFKKFFMRWKISSRAQIAHALTKVDDALGEGVNASREGVDEVGARRSRGRSTA